MDKLTAIKIKYYDGTYSDEIPVSVLSKNVEWDSTHTLVDVLGNIDIDTGTIQDQISRLFNEKASITQLNNYVASQLNTNVTNWLNTNVNPVGSAVIVDSSLTVSGAAADAKVVGDKIADLDDLKSAMNLLHDEIPTTVQTYVFTDGSVSQVLHKSGNTTVRTDTFTYATNTITEVRTLNTGESLTIVTNLQTLETTVTYAAA